MSEIFIEAESFRKLGGWVIDQQSFEVIHSSYIMAHGMGVPVDDACTDFQVTEGGKYKVWVLTRDWTAPWKIAEPAGKFKIKIDEEFLGATLGTESEDWAWQYAGECSLDRGTHSISLCDLTGFNGRCDAIYITDGDETPKSDISYLDEMRKRFIWSEIEDEETEYDLAVVGGGIAGVCFALTAVRSGVRTALIQDREVLGGCNSSDVRVCAGGQIKLAPYENIGDVVREITPILGDTTLYDKEYFEDHRKLCAFRIWEGHHAEHKIMTGKAVTNIEKEGRSISAVICTDIRSGKKTRIRAKLFADCSGDGILARLGGAEVMYGRDARDTFGESLAPKEAERLVMGHSIRWCSERESEKSDFPHLSWLPIDENSYLDCLSGDWEQETGFTRDMVAEIEYIRDYGLLAIYSNWSYQKNKHPEKFGNYRLRWVSAIGGKRESYRVAGDYVITQRDIEEMTPHPDATAAITWGIDLHFPEPTNEMQFGEAFRSFAYHRGMPKACGVPYRCLYSKDIDNLFLGGRLISASHVAFSAMRVMRTLGMLGEVAGLASSLCTKYSCKPRDIYEKHLEELLSLMKQGVKIPESFAGNGVKVNEQYHFKDIGWWNLHNRTHNEDSGERRKTSEKDLEKLRRGVEHLGIDHLFPIPEKWNE